MKNAMPQQQDYSQCGTRVGGTEQLKSGDNVDFEKEGIAVGKSIKILTSFGWRTFLVLDIQGRTVLGKRES